MKFFNSAVAITSLALLSTLSLTGCMSTGYPSYNKANFTVYGAQAGESLAGNQQALCVQGDLTLECTNPQSVLEAVLVHTRELGGYVDTVRADRVVVRVPSAQYAALVAECAKLGTLQKRDTRADNEAGTLSAHQREYLELQARISQLEQELQTEQHEDVRLRLIQQLNTLQQRLSVLTGQIATAENQVKFSTLTVVAVPTTAAILQSPVEIDWINELARRVCSPYLPLPERRLHRDDFDWNIPQGFIRTEDKNNVTSGVNAHGVQLRLSRHVAQYGADVSFLSQVIMRSMAEQEFELPEEITLLQSADGVEVHMLAATRTLAGEQVTHLVAVMIAPETLFSSEKVIAFEMWGKSDAVTSAKDSFNLAISQLRTR